MLIEIRHKQSPTRRKAENTRHMPAIVLANFTTHSKVARTHYIVIHVVYVQYVHASTACMQHACAMRYVGALGTVINIEARHVAVCGASRLLTSFHFLTSVSHSLWVMDEFQFNDDLDGYVESSTVPLTSPQATSTPSSENGSRMSALVSASDDASSETSSQPLPPGNCLLSHNWLY